jgi:hypothetical protein
MRLDLSRAPRDRVAQHRGDRAIDHRLAFDLPINKDVVRRILVARYQPKPSVRSYRWQSHHRGLYQTLIAA